MTEPELIAIDLTDDERDFMQTALTEFGGTASYRPFPIKILGVSTDDEFEELLVRLRGAIARKYALSELDWARAQLLTEMCWGSFTIGSGFDFTYSYRDEQAAPFMRSIQRKLRRHPLGRALFPDYGGRRSYAQNQAPELTTEPELIEIDLPDDERQFMRTAITEFGGTASNKPFPIKILGVSTADEFDDLLVRLRIAIERGEALSALDWARALLLTEICWASDMIGSGTAFTQSYPDKQAAPLMRVIQRRLRRYPLARTLFPDNGGRRTYAEVEAMKRQREAQGKSSNCS